MELTIESAIVVSENFAARRVAKLAIELAVKLAK
jgi:hypothetical protein